MISTAISILSFFWNLFADWLYLFVSPVENFQVLWIIIPIWLAWFFGEFFQEKKGTNFGNAISNGVVPFWVGLDWTRLLVNGLLDGRVQWSELVLFKFLVCLGLFAYGLAILIHGIKGRQLARYIGRIRQITYVMLVFTPVIYGIIPFSGGYFLGIVFFYPLFYYFIEMIDRNTPNPRTLEMDEAPQGVDSGDVKGRGGAPSQFWR